MNARAAERAKRELLCEYASDFGSKVFVETGTYKGETVKAMLMSKLFSKIYSIEIYEDRALNAQRRFAQFNCVHCYHGDSAEVLPQILNELFEPALFWLDAHHSGKQIARTRGLIETPLKAELIAILNHHLAHQHVILIDDARYLETFSQKYDHYPSTEELRQLYHQVLPDHTFVIKDDILRCHRSP